MEFTIQGESLPEAHEFKKEIYITSPGSGDITIAVNDGEEIARATVSFNELQQVMSIIMLNHHRNRLKDEKYVRS